VARARKRGAHRTWWQRRPLPGMLLHINGSRHQWFQDERWYDLIVILVDASNQIYYAQLVEEESSPARELGVQIIPAYSPQTRLAIQNLLDCSFGGDMILCPVAELPSRMCSWGRNTFELRHFVNTKI
jgi:hypothetical protein